MNRFTKISTKTVAKFFGYSEYYRQCFLETLHFFVKLKASQHDVSSNLNPTTPQTGWTYLSLLETSGVGSDSNFRGAKLVENSLEVLWKMHHTAWSDKICRLDSLCLVQFYKCSHCLCLGFWSTPLTCSS